MKKRPGYKPASIVLTAFLSVWTIMHVDLTTAIESSSIPGMQTAAARQYGIQGQQAPALNLTTWIDARGLASDPIELAQYRGKVIYLYFFQDW